MFFESLRLQTAVHVWPDDDLAVTLTIMPSLYNLTGNSLNIKYLQTRFEHFKSTSIFYKGHRHIVAKKWS